ncbi:PQQ-binding-like beta-propeller repeat protein OS=Streptomyces griseomycini OX=66895 GN=FHS37_004167 PE=4 SV=1 [Streptomyces griseomycini]
MPAPKVPKGVSTVVTSGSWLTDTVYAKSGIAEIVGYDRDKGTEKWTIDLPGPVCAASGRYHRGQQDGDRLQAGHADRGRSQSCTQVGLIDLEAGKELWSKSAKTGTMPINFNNVTLEQDLAPRAAAAAAPPGE